MPTPVTAAEFAALDLPGWRYLLGTIEATFTAPSFVSAAELAVLIAQAADAANHHPDIDLRPMRTVCVSLSTHDVGGVTDLDVNLARAISALAARHPATPQPAAALQRTEGRVCTCHCRDAETSL